ncbi:MAG: site-2 protease family protein, partial [Opitutaceae bacterium]|nr:site-2 protease family protein [Opitutaceae bacterium]
THPTPFEQLTDNVLMTVRTLASLINPQSDIGLSKMSGPVGIVRILHSAAQVGLTAVIMFTILINVNLAIFNLLPIPVLDGGQMLFATIARLRGRALPTNFIAATQSAFVLLLFGMMIYVTVFGDIRRLFRDIRGEKPAATAPADAGE